MQNPGESPKPSPDQSDPLKILEYAAVAASAVGSIAAAWLEQILFAATPLTLAVMLNLINRQRFEQRLGRYTTSAIADIRMVVEQLHQKLQQQQVDPQFLHEPQSMVDPQFHSDLDPIIEAITQLQRVTQQMENDVLRQQDWEVMNVRFQLMEEKIEGFNPQPSMTLPQLDTEADLPPMETTTVELPPIAQSSVDLSAIQSQINHLHDQVVKLDQQNREIVKPYLHHLVRSIKELQQHYHN